MLDELDEYECPRCGRTNESCRCEDGFDGYFDFVEDYMFDNEEAPEEPICYLNGKPLYKSELDDQEERC